MFSRVLSNAKNQKGFSLVELMVVVAIIGILAAVAVPSISKYMAKARQSESKANLGSFYTANKAFFAEYNFYHSSFGVIGFVPEGAMKYNVGFAANSTIAAANLIAFGYTSGYGAAGTVKDVANRIATVHCAIAGVGCTNAGMPVAASITAACALAGENNALPAAGGVGANAFLVCAAGRPNPNAPAGIFDTWTMNQDKALTNTIDGIL